MSKTKVSVGPYGNDSERSSTNFRVLWCVTWSVTMARFVEKDVFILKMISSVYILRSLSTLRFVSWSYLVECESILFVTNHIPYLRGLSNFFFQTAALTFVAAKLFHRVIRERTKHKLKLRILSDSWHKTLNFISCKSLWNVTFCEFLHESKPENVSF